MERSLSIWIVIMCHFHYESLLLPKYLLQSYYYFLWGATFWFYYFFQPDIYSKTPMEKTELQNQLKLKQTELNLTTDPDKKRKLATDIEIINHKLSIERIKQIIQNLSNR